MTSQEERIKMAEELRSYVDGLGSSIDSADIVETILLVTIRYRDTDGVALLPTSHASLIAMLADLIDPTCHVSVKIESDGECFCFGCGEMIGEYDYPRYCPHCGARIIDGEWSGDAIG